MLDNEFICIRIQELLDEYGISRYELAKRADMNDTSLYDIMKRKSTPGLINLSRICDGFGITVSQFFRTDGEPVELSEREKHMLRLWRRLSTMNKLRAESYLLGLSED